MVNLLGFEESNSTYQEQRNLLQALPQAHLHWYGKRLSRPGRKLGHVTLLLHSLDAGLRQIETYREFRLGTETLYEHDASG